MTVPTNTRTVYGAIGIREDLSNIIYNISPTDTPFLSGCGRETADNTFFEWQTDDLTTAAANRSLLQSRLALVTTLRSVLKLSRLQVLRKQWISPVGAVRKRISWPSVLKK